MNKKIIEKVSYNPLKRVVPEKNFHNLENSICSDTNLKHCQINSNKKVVPMYFYQRKKVRDIIDEVIEDNFNNDKCINKSSLSGSKRHTGPLVNDVKVNDNDRDIDVSNIMRGGYTRLENPEFQKERESIDDMRLQFLTKNYQDPEKLILPFPRGGEITREKYYKNYKGND